MTEERSGSSSALCVRERVSAHLKRREDECIVILARAYIDVATKLNGDVSEVYRLFNEFTTTVAKAPVPRRRRGNADPEYDVRILAAGDAAPRGQKEAAVAAEAGAQTTRATAARSVLG